VRITGNPAAQYSEFLLRLDGEHNDAGILLTPDTGTSSFIDFAADSQRATSARGRIGRNPAAQGAALFVGAGGALGNALQIGQRDPMAVQIFTADICRMLYWRNGNIGVGFTGIASDTPIYAFQVKTPGVLQSAVAAFGGAPVAGYAATMTGDLPIRLRAANTRYRSDWAINNYGLNVSVYDDTAATYLPFSFSGSDITLKCNGGSTTIQTGASPVTRVIITDGGTYNYNLLRIQTPNGTSPYLELFQTGLKNWTVAIPASGTSFQVLEDGGTPRLTIKAGGVVNVGLTKYADSATAYGAGLRAGDLYHINGTVKVMY
jgi:hypothetical protein